MPTVFVFQKHVSWQEIFQRLPRPVQRLCAGNVGNTTKHLRSFRCKILYLMNYCTLCTGIPRRSAANFQARFPSGQMMLEPRKPLFPVDLSSEWLVVLQEASTCEGMCSNVLPPQVRINVITSPTPPHPHPCIHAPTGSHRQACPSSASSHERYYMPHPTPPHPTPPPRCVQKHHGLLKAVVQLSVNLLVQYHISIWDWPKTLYPQNPKV